MEWESTGFDFTPYEDAPTPESPEGFDSLVENALDFLQRSLEEVKERPKYSVIHFCSGIELLLKARLLSEHWALVTVKPGEASKLKFKAGEFESVNLRQCFERLENVCEERLPEERACFMGLAAHRNRVVHFFHDAYAEKPDPKLLEQIVLEQLKAGALIIRLLTRRWRTQFEAYEEAIEKLHSSLRRHKQYLAAKFEVVKPALEEFKASGGEVWECFLRKLPTAKLLRDDPMVKWTRCMVCDFSRNYIRVQCPECEEGGKQGVIDFDAGKGSCDECDTEFGMDLLLTEFDAEGVASCPECSHTTGTVIEYGDGYLCLSCGNDFDRIGECDWCSESVAGDLSNSYLDGCMFCDGLYGHTADD
jgi:hypothetical protein